MCQEPHGAGCPTLVILKLQVSWSLVTSYIEPQSQYLRSKFQSFPNEDHYVYMRGNCRKEVREKRHRQSSTLGMHLLSQSGVGAEFSQKYLDY